MPIRKMHQNLLRGHDNGHHYGHFKMCGKHHHHHHHTHVGKPQGFAIMNGYKREFSRFMNKMAPSHATKTKMAGLAVLGAVVVSSGLVVKGLMNIFKHDNSKISKFNKDLTVYTNIQKLHEKLDGANVAVKVSFLGSRVLDVGTKHDKGIKYTEMSLDQLKSQVAKAKTKLQEDGRYYQGSDKELTNAGSLLEEIEEKLNFLTTEMEKVVSEQNPFTRAMAHMRH